MNPASFLPAAKRWLLPLLAAPLLLAQTGCEDMFRPYNRGIAHLQLMQSTELPDDQMDRISGTYKGLATRVSPDDPRCPTARTGTLELGDNRLELAYTPGLIFTAPVQPDGSVVSVVGPSKLQGRIANGYASFTVTTPNCTTRFDYRYVI